MSEDTIKTDLRAPRYVLITQCLQNDFFLNSDCGLCLPKDEVSRLLVGRETSDQDRSIMNDLGRYRLPKGYPEKGPLGRFLKESMDVRASQEPDPTKPENILHVINIRDVHKVSEQYDKERRLYGAHCESGSDGVGYVKGLEDHIDPKEYPQGKRGSETEGRIFQQGNLRIYHVKSNDVFDFAAGEKSELEYVLDMICYGEEKDIQNLKAIGEIKDSNHKFPEKTEKDCPDLLYVGVIGVYTDIKISTLLIGLKSQYPVSNLAVSDSLTGSPSFERHISALDFANRILGAEVIHGLNDMLRFLGGTASIENSSLLVGSQSYANLSSYQQDKQHVLAHRDRMLSEYFELTESRAKMLYSKVDKVFDWNFRFGIAFMGLALLYGLSSLASSLFPNYVELPGEGGLFAGAGILGALQVFSRVFFRKQSNDRIKNLMNLVSLRIILENHSLKAALSRFHLTTPETLSHNLDPDKAKVQLDIITREVDLLSRLEKKTYAALRDLVEKRDGEGDEDKHSEPNNLNTEPETKNPEKR